MRVQTSSPARDGAVRVKMLADEPPRFADRRYDALVGAIASRAAATARMSPARYQRERLGVLRSTPAPSCIGVEAQR